MYAFYGQPAICCTRTGPCHVFNLILIENYIAKNVRYCKRTHAIMYACQRFIRIAFKLLCALNVIFVNFYERDKTIKQKIETDASKLICSKQ